MKRGTARVCTENNTQDIIINEKSLEISTGRSVLHFNAIICLQALLCCFLAIPTNIENGSSDNNVAQRIRISADEDSKLNKFRG